MNIVVYPYKVETQLKLLPASHEVQWSDKEYVAPILQLWLEVDTSWERKKNKNSPNICILENDLRLSELMGGHKPASMCPEDDVAVVSS